MLRQGRRIGLLSAAALGLMLTIGSVWAEGEYERHRAEGRRLYRQKDYGKAVEELKKAREVRTEAGLLVEMGMAYLRWGGHGVEALRACSAFYKEAAAGDVGIRKHADRCVEEANQQLDRKLDLLPTLVHEEQANGKGKDRKPRGKKPIDGAGLVRTPVPVAPPVAQPVVKAPANLCDPQIKDPQVLAMDGLTLYRQAAAHDRTDQSKTYERAMRCFLRAMELTGDGGTKLYHPLGLTYEKLERYPEAVEAFMRFLAETREIERNPGVTRQIEDKLAVLRKQVSMLNIETVAGLDIRVDERPLGKAPLRRLIPVMPGPHTVVVGNAEEGTLGIDIEVMPGQVRLIDLNAWKPRPK